MSNFDESLLKRLTQLEREVERLRVKEKPDMSNYARITTLATPASVYSSKQFDVDTTTTYDVQDVSIPAAAKMVYLRTYSRWNAASSSYYLAFEKYGTSNIWLVARANTDTTTEATGWVEVDNNGRFNVRCAGASTQSECAATVLAYME